MTTQQVLIKVHVCDDDPLVADALAAFVAAAPRLTVAGVHHGGEALLEALDDTTDVVLLDVRMPGLDGPSVARRIRERGLSCRVIYLSSFPAAVPVDDALTGTVVGALSKAITPAALALAVESAHAGLTSLSGEMLPRAREPMAERIAALATWDRERAMLDLVARDLSNREIADELCVSTSTVKQGIAAIQRRGGFASRTALLLHLHGVDVRSVQRD